MSISCCGRRPRGTSHAPGLRSCHHGSRRRAAEIATPSSGGNRVSRVQARIELSAQLSALVEPHRQRWNPERARRNPAHVTVVYHDEAPLPGLLRDRLAAAVSQLPVFELALGLPRRFLLPAAGVFLEVTDPAGAIARLREQVLREPFHPRTAFGLHVTILHPDYAHRMPEAWPELSQLRPSGSMQVAEISLIGPSNEPIERFPFSERSG